MTVAGGVTFGSSGAAMATAGRTEPTLDPTPYPPKANVLTDSNVHTNNKGHIQSDTEVEVFVKMKDLEHERHWRGGGCAGGCAEESGAELPMTGAPVQTLAAIGAGLLFLGASGTLIAVRRRRSSSAS
ncbi:LPXTG cell wall anchor domain-containing protein [Nonomuraea sp. NPDC048916]|uniref:LPXTG cell wall anchor domain-containing protein n=1 Tax=Nonomuraea sp. NPDC048916 TaxID=3154232 RepID=UPI00340AB310